ncbi:MAG: hypothetical protein QW698_07455 [Nitrososphaerales archaeon]
MIIIPPVKTRMTIMVDIDVAEYYEKKWNDEVMNCIKRGDRKPSFSEFMNSMLKKYIQIEKRMENMRDLH